MIIRIKKKRVRIISNDNKNKESSIERPHDANSKGESLDPEVLEDLPPEVRKQISLMVSSRSSYQGPFPNPLIEKLTESHIDKIIQASIEEDDKSFKYANNGRAYTFVYSIVGVALFVFLLVFLIDKNPELLFEILKIVGLVVGGGAGGYGLRAYKEGKSK